MILLSAQIILHSCDTSTADMLLTQKKTSILSHYLPGDN
jgi:hypothetical protein